MARLVFTSEYYTLELTDLCSVWSEHLESAGLRERQQKCSCPVTLQSRGEILHFGEFLSKHLPYAEIRTDEEGYAVKVGHTALGKEISFEFELEKIAPAKASLILAELTLGFKNVIEALGNRLEQLNEVIQEKELSHSCYGRRSIALIGLRPPQARISVRRCIQKKRRTDQN